MSLISCNHFQQCSPVNDLPGLNRSGIVAAECLFREFVTALREHSHAVQVRTNLTVMLDTRLDETAEFLRDHAGCPKDEPTPVQRFVRQLANSHR